MRPIADARLQLRPIGRLETPFKTLDQCPRNGRQLPPVPQCLAILEPEFIDGLKDVDGFTHLILIYLLDQAREPVMTLKPPFDDSMRGLFATRAPCRPNPLGLSVVTFDGFDGPGRLKVRYLDCLDGTPLIDIKPYLRTTDAEPHATMGWLQPE